MIVYILTALGIQFVYDSFLFCLKNIFEKYGILSDSGSLIIICILTL